MRPLVFAGLVVLAAAALGACGEEPPAPPPPPVRKAAPVVDPAAVADAGVAPLPAHVYMYNPLGKRDPFRSYVDELPREGLSESQQACTEPLCQWDLDQLALVAVVSGDANPVAMVEDPGRVGHILHRNTKVGKQGGKITQILRDCVIVTEYWQGPDGKSNPNPVKLCIKQESPTALPSIDLMNPQKRWE